MTCANAAAPLGLNFGNVTVSPLNGRAQARGIAVGIGEPQQIISLVPALGDDNTFVFNAADCVSATNFTCIAAKGGVYNSSLSPSTFRQTTQQQWNGTNQPAEFEGGSYIFFNDDIHFGSTGFLPGFPMFENQPGQGSSSGLGLAINSTFLKSVVNSGQAPTTGFGMWAGSRSENHAVDGSLYVGGYDSARVYGDLSDFTNFPMSNNGLCATCVKVTSMTYTNSLGSTSLLTTTNNNIQIGLDPFWHGLQVPPDIFAKFLQATGGVMRGSLVALPPAGDLGNISVTINGKYNTVIPAQELWLPNYYYGSDGSVQITNNTYLIGEIYNSTPAANIVYTWGMPFLTMNYMIMDYNNLTMKLAPAIQGPPGTNQGSLVQPLCHGVASKPSPTPTTSVSPGPTTTVNPTPVSQSHTNVGAIAGGVVGGVLGLALIAVLAFFLFRRDKRNKAHHQDEIASTVHHPGSVAGSTTIAPGSQADRMSKIPPSSPTEISEADHQNVSHWLHAQEHKYPVEQTTHASPTLNQPFEMPAHYPEHR